MQEQHSPIPNPETGPDIPFRDAAVFWLKLGFISFGGPAGQIAIMHRELVEQRRSISERRFLQALNYCMVLPGPEAQQLATYLGWLMHRTTGGLIAGLLFILPAFLLLMLLAHIYLVWGDTPLLTGIFTGVKPAVTAIVLHAAWRIGQRTLTGVGPWTISIAAFLGLAIFKLPFPLIILIAAISGWLIHQYGSAHGITHHTARPAGKGETAIIDDDTPPPLHARFSARRSINTLLVGIALWAVTLGSLALWKDPGHPLVTMGRFFTEAALLTFGGAYAVLPWVFQGAVETHGWLTATQMIDALALGETTPGPLIMVVTFVGYVAGFGNALLGGVSPVVSGLVAATVVTWFTFLPSFIFILAGAPLIESGRDVKALAAPLSAITAAVVGVIVNLALWFAAHAIFQGGQWLHPDPFALCIAAIAAVALFVSKRSVLEVIGGSAAIGAVWSLLQ